MYIVRLRLSLIASVALACSIHGQANAQQSRQVPAYDPAQTKTVLNRSVFYLPLFGAVYREKFAALLGRMPGVRGVIIHNHGCAGMWGWETTVAQFYYREGFAVITPEFVTREGNKLGCPGGSVDEMLSRAGERAREGVYTAINPARLDARGDDIEAVIRWVKTLTALPIFLSGHSEGCRTTYHWNRRDPQVKGGICHKQSVNRRYEHLWQWDTRLPMWSSIEDEDPWAGGSKEHPAVGFKEKFKDNPQNLTEFRYPGNSHDPLVRPGERQSLREWLNRQVTLPPLKGEKGFDYEELLPAVQDAVSRSAPAS
jgi:dienelactone hydrolase